MLWAIGRLSGDNCLPTPHLASVDRRPTNYTIKEPRYVWSNIDTWLSQHEEHTVSTLCLLALSKVGIDIEPEDLTPQRKRLNALRAPDGDPREPIPRCVRIPRYVRMRAEHHLRTRPDLTFKHLVMQGLHQLGIAIDSEDLVAVRTRRIALGDPNSEDSDD